MEMFDTQTVTTFDSEGNAEQTAVKSERLMRKACAVFIAAHRRFEHLDRDPESVYVKEKNLEWWDALELLYEKDKALWRLFVGEQPTRMDNMLYAKFRESLLACKKLRANA